MSSSVLLVVVVLGALTAAVASAVRATGGGAARPSQVVETTPVTPGVAAAAPEVSSALGVVQSSPAPSERPVPVRPAAPKPSAPPVVTVPTPPVPSRAVGRPNRGRLENGVLLPAEGTDHTTWDAIGQVSPNRDWRRVGSDRLVRTLLVVAARYRRTHPGAPRVVISDLSLPQGGRFGPEYGGSGHASHQNGLDVDVAYPRADGREIGVDRVGQIDRRLAQALVDAFVEAGAQYVFVGPRTRLRGPRAVVQKLANHDDHLHVRIPNRG